VGSDILLASQVRHVFMFIVTGSFLGLTMKPHHQNYLVTGAFGAAILYGSLGVSPYLLRYFKSAKSSIFLMGTPVRELFSSLSKVPSMRRLLSKIMKGKTGLDRLFRLLHGSIITYGRQIWNGIRRKVGG
jgi:hypothetical protein